MENPITAQKPKTRYTKVSNSQYLVFGTAQDSRAYYMLCSAYLVYRNRMSIYQYIELKNRLLAQQPIPQRTKKKLYFLFSKIAQHKIRETKSFISTVKNEYIPVNSGCYVNLKAQAKKELFANNPIIMFLSQKTNIPILQYTQDRIIKVILKETAQLNNFWLRKLSDIVEIETKYRLCLQNGQHSETGQINKTLVVVK